MSGATFTHGGAVGRPGVLSNVVAVLAIGVGLLALLAFGYFLALALALAVLAAPYFIAVRAVAGRLRSPRGPRQSPLEKGDLGMRKAA